MSCCYFNCASTTHELRNHELRNLQYCESGGKRCHRQMVEAGPQCGCAAHRVASSRMMPFDARTIVRERRHRDVADVCGVHEAGLSPPAVARQHSHLADKARLERVLTLFVITSRHPPALQ